MKWVIRCWIKVSNKSSLFKAKLIRLAFLFIVLFRIFCLRFFYHWLFCISSSQSAAFSVYLRCWRFRNTFFLWFSIFCWETHFGYLLFLFNFFCISTLASISSSTWNIFFIFWNLLLLLRITFAFLSCLLYTF